MGRRDVPQITPQQTAADANYFRAMADYEANPRYTSKKFQRAGLSSGKGTLYAGAGESANAYAKNMAQSAGVGMQDSYYNANMLLGDQVRNDQFHHALAGLAEDQSQRNAMYQIQQAQQASGFMGDMLRGMSGGFGGGQKDYTSLLMGLL
jgi:hypothetical protein